MPRRREPKGRQRTHAHASVAMEGWGRAPVPQGSAVSTIRQLSADIQHQTSAQRRRARAAPHSDQIRYQGLGMGACGTVSAHTMAHHSSECRVWQPLARNCSRYCNFGQRFPEVQVLCQTHSMDVSGWRRAGQLVSASVPCVFGARPPRPRGPHRCVFNNPIIPTLTSSLHEQP